MNRKIISILVAIIFFFGAVTFYINTVTIPEHLHKIIIQETQKFLGRKLSLKSIHFNPFAGFLLDGIVIFEKDSPDIFATVDHVRANFLYWPFFREKKIVLSSVELKGVTLNLVHYTADQWNFTDILELRSKNAQRRSAKIYFSHLMLTDGRVKVTDLEDGSQFSEIFDPTNITADLSFSKGVTFRVSTNIPDKQGSLEINGNYLPLQNKLTSGIKLRNIALKNYIRLARLQLPLDLDDVSIDGMDIRLNAGNHLANVSGDVSLSALALHTEQQSFELKSLMLRQMDFAFNDGEVNFKGHTLAQKVKVTSQGRSYGADGIDLQVDQWTSRGQAFNASGSLNAITALVEIPEQMAIKFDVHLRDLRLSRGLNVFNADGSAELKDTSFAIGQDIRMSGDFSSPTFAVTITPETTTAKGNLYADKLVYQWPPGKELRGQIALTDIRINGSPKAQWTARSQLRGQSIGIKLPGDKNLTADVIGQAALEYRSEQKTFQIKSNYQLSNGAFTMANGLTLTGNPSGTVFVSSKTDPLKPVPYNGTLEFTDAAFLGTRIGPVEHIQGAVSFQNNEIKTSNLNFNALGMPASLSGTLNDFSSPTLDVKVHVNDFNLADAQKIIPEILNKNHLTLTGIAPELDITYQGSVTTTENADIHFAANIRDSSITSQTLNKTASKLSGAINYEEKILSWKNLNAKYDEKLYLLTGKIIQSPRPTIETSIEADQLKLKTRFEYSPDSITFEQLMGRYKRMVFNVTGTTKTTSNGAPLMDLSGEAELDLKDLTDLFPKISDTIKNYHLSGMTKITGQFKGDATHWQDWQFNLTGASALFSIMGLNLQNMKFNAVGKNNILKPLHVWGDFYGGELNVVASLDTAKKDLPFELVGRMLNSDLNKLRVDTPLKKESLAGILSATAIIDGKLTDLKNMNGKGGIDIKDGRLWELDLLKGLGGILLIPEYKDIVFTQAGMNFTLNNGIMSTENLQLLGPSLNLLGKGTLDLNQDQALNLLLSPDFNADVIVGSSSLKKGTTAIITQTEKFMSINVTGTLKKPQYKVNNSPVKILQKTGGVILENVSQFFQNIF